MKNLIPGNHDFSVADADKGKVLAALGMKDPYYSKVVKGWRFVFLDGTDTAVWRHPGDDPRAAAAKAVLTEMTARTGHRVNPAGDTAIGAEQLAWMGKELDAAAREGQRVIVFNHYPVVAVSGIIRAGEGCPSLHTESGPPGFSS